MQFDFHDGIKRNADGTEKSYQVWIKDKDKKYSYKYVTIPRIGEKSGKIQMIHAFNPEYAGQNRGYSRLGFALQELENITDFSVSIIKKAINNSNLLLSVENQQQDPGNPFEGITHENFNALGQDLLTEPTAQEITDIDRRYNLNVCPIPEAGLDTPGSTAVVGNQQGDTIRILDNKTPNEPFRDFITAFLERLCAATGNPIEVVLMKFGQNYSASRATLVLAWRVYCYWREEMATDFLNIVFECWLGGEIAMGRIVAPGFLDPVMKCAWINCSWIGSRMPDIDPGKTAKAAKDNLEMSLTTPEREARNLNGSSAKENIIKNKKYFSEMPSPPWSKGQGGDQQENKDNEDNEDMKEGEENG
jgi:capsid protein